MNSFWIKNIRIAPPALSRAIVTLVGLTISLMGIVGCEKETPVEAVPVKEYIQPEEKPTFISPGGDKDHHLKFTDITAQAGIEYRHETGAFGQKWMPETMGGGGAFFDYDGDDYPDILLINSGYWLGHEPTGKNQPTSALYRNRGDGTFEDVSESSGLSRLAGYGMGAAIADYDGDGDQDIYVTAVGHNHLLRNDDGVYVDVTEKSGVGVGVTGQSSSWQWSTGAVWVDYDRDGDLDLFVANYVQWTPETDIWTTLDGKTKSYATPQRYQGTTCVLFRNEGDGRFVDATKQAGVHNPLGKSMSVVTDDFNDDGWPDLMVTNDTQPNFLYINTKKGGFEDEALFAGIAYDENGLARAGMGVSVTDLKNKGQRSIAIGNFSGEPMSLYTQTQADTFIDRAGATRLTNPTSDILTFGVLFADMNLDGYEDLITANGHIEPDISATRENWTFAQPVKLFLNNANGKFVDITDDLGEALRKPMVGRSLAVADIDGDGDLDILVTANGGSPRLIRNDYQGNAHVVRIRLVGPTGNGTAIGARITAVANHQVMTRYITTGGSYLSQSEMTATFGLDVAKSIDKLSIRWPDGTEQTLSDIPANQLHVIQQGQGIIHSHPLRR